MQAMPEPFTGPVLADWIGVSAWKRSFLGAAATRGLRELYTVKHPAVPAISTPQPKSLYRPCRMACRWPRLVKLCSRAHTRSLRTWPTPCEPR